MSERTSMTRRAVLSGAAGAAAVTTVPVVSAQDGGPDYGGWFDGVSNFKGTADYTGQSEVTVWVGAQGNGGYFAFSPPAIRVDPGATVTWTWTGEGGSHNVVAQDDAYRSELSSEEGHTFTHTFEGSGDGVSISKYFCVPHRSLGMKGAVVVGGSGGLDPGSYDTPSTGAGGGGSESGGGGGGFSIGALSIVGTLLVGLLSPLFFAIFLLFQDSEEESAT
ncbi:halocyanin domain-containing protein [Halobacterium zhouii]|uniref:halocyanin domain-containing protein n=1 Tax=Halobacterium zhouii TaxID=2902624 RepID=UPI001E36B1C9|nr:halocyanin domain-containing protein [Halobacterium zhouii]